MAGHRPSDAGTPKMPLLPVMPCWEQAWPPPHCLLLCSSASSPQLCAGSISASPNPAWACSTRGLSWGFKLGALLLLTAASVKWGQTGLGTPSLIPDPFLNIPAWKCSRTTPSGCGGGAENHPMGWFHAGVRRCPLSVPPTVSSGLKLLKRLQPRRDLILLLFPSVRPWGPGPDPPQSTSASAPGPRAPRGRSPWPLAPRSRTGTGARGNRGSQR